jgi:2-methylisocitrate lyase-like PEP mutase family enzyme
MVMEGVPPNGRLAELGVSRISYGPMPYAQASETLRQEARKVLS